jgi:hypothetical protein
MPPTTSTSYGASTWTTVTYPVTSTTGFVIDVLDFGADPTGQRDSTQAIQNAIDFAAHLVLLKDVAPVTMPPERRALYQVYEDAWRATQGLPPVAAVQVENRWRAATAVGIGLLLLVVIGYLVYERRRR